MTMHLPGYEAPRGRRGGIASIREDVHVHLGMADLRAFVADPPAYRAWLPDAITQFEADSEGLRFHLRLLGRSEGGDLRRAPSDNPREIVFTQSEGGNVDQLTWALYPEGQRECHLTVELTYRPAAGLLGGAMETMFHRGQRIQVLRDLLWSLKQDVERSAARPPSTALGRESDGNRGPA